MENPSCGFDMPSRRIHPMAFNNHIFRGEDHDRAYLGWQIRQNGQRQAPLRVSLPFHMSIPRLLFEMRRVLKPGGALTIANVGGSLRWKLPGVRSLIKIATFFYFLVTENIFRGWTETSALSNVYTAEEWQSSLRESGFMGIRVAELPKSHAWIPSPLLITAKKPIEKG